MGAAGNALFPKRETPAPVEDRSVQMPPVQPQGASIQAASPRPVNRNPMVALPSGATTQPYRPTGDSSAMFRSTKPEMQPSNPQMQGINQDMAGFAQQQPKKIDVVNQQLNQQVQEELKQLKPEAAELASQQEIMDSAYAYTLAKNSPTYAQVQEDPELGSDFQNTLKKAFGNEEMWLTLAMGFNGMRLRPDATLGAALADRLKTIRASKKSNRTVQALRARGMNNIADYIEQTGDVPGGMKMAVQAGQYISGTGADIETQFGKMGLDPTKPYRYNKMTGKVESIGGAGVSIDMAGEKAEDVERAKLFAKRMSSLAEQREGATDALASVQALQQLGEQPDMNQIPNILRGFLPQGINAGVDAYKAALVGVAQSQRQKGTGAQSDKDIDLLIQKAGPIATDIKARRIAQQMLADKAQRNLEQARIADNYSIGRITKEEAMAQMDALESKPLLSDELRGYMNSLGATQVKPPENASDRIKSLWQYMTPEERDEVKRELGAG